MSRKLYKPKIPKITYQFIDSKEGEERLKKAYRILFEAVMKNQNWGPDTETP